MATVAELPAEVKNTSESEPKRKRQSTLPKPDAKTLQPEAFYKYTQGLTDTDWPHVIIYVWRQWPRIIREPKYIDKLSSAVTEEYLLTHHGSGKYWLALNDTDTDQTVCQTYPEFDNPMHPPLLDLRELDIAHDKNRTFVDHLKRTGKLTMDGEVVQQGRDSSTNTEANGITQIALEAMRMNRDAKPGMENQAFSKMMDMMANASAKSIEIAMSQVKKEDPSGFLSLMIQMMQSQQTTMTTLLTKLLEGNSNKGADPMMAVLLKQIDLSEKRAEAAEARARDEHKAAEAEKQRAHEKEMKALEMRGDPMEMIDKVLNIQQKLGGGERSRRPGWPGVIEDHADELLGVAKYAVDKLGGAMGYRAQPAQHQQPRPAQTVQQQPQGQPQQPQPVAQTQPSQPQQPQGEPMPSLDPEIAFLLPILEVQGRNFVAAFIADPDSGADVARTVSLFGGAATYERIARMGREKILATIELIPQMKADLAKAGTAEMLSDFIDDFIAGPEDPDEDPDEDPVIPEGKQKKAREPKAVA